MLQQTCLLAEYKVGWPIKCQVIFVMTNQNKEPSKPNQFTPDWWRIFVLTNYITAPFQPNQPSPDWWKIFENDQLEHRRFQTKPTHSWLVDSSCNDQLYRTQGFQTQPTHSWLVENIWKWPVRTQSLSNHPALSCSVENICKWPCTVEHRAFQTIQLFPVRWKIFVNDQWPCRTQGLSKQNKIHLSSDWVIFFLFHFVWQI